MQVLLKTPFGIEHPVTVHCAYIEEKDEISFVFQFENKGFQIRKIEFYSSIHFRKSLSRNTLSWAGCYLKRADDFDKEITSKMRDTVKEFCEDSIHSLLDRKGFIEELQEENRVDNIRKIEKEIEELQKQLEEKKKMLEQKRLDK